MGARSRGKICSGSAILFATGVGVRSWSWIRRFSAHPWNQKSIALGPKLVNAVTLPSSKESYRRCTVTGRQETTAQKSKPMRLVVSILAPIALAAISLFTSPAEVVGQNRSAAREWSDLAKGRTEFEVSDPALVPNQLALAVEQSDCRQYELLIKGDPIRFVVLRDRRFAIVLCSVGASNSHQLFDLSGRSNLEKPKLVRLPFLEQPDGFGTTPTPGAITWKSESGVLVAESGSDNSPERLRHTYRLGYLSTMSFVVVRVEYRCAECSKDEWKGIWDAPHWPSKYK
jgi:hypothetical protein